MTAALSGLAAWYPEQVRDNSVWPANFGKNRKTSDDRTFNDIPPAIDEAARVTDRYLEAEKADPFLGVLERRVAPDELSSVQAETLAARAALDDAGLSAEQIDVVISYSVTPDRLTPASAPRVAENLGIKGALAWGLDAACASALVQMATAKALVESGQAEHVLLTQSHLLLRAFPLLHPAAPGLGDAATAFIVSRKGRFPIIGTEARSHGEFYESVTWVRDGDAPDAPWWREGGNFRVGSLDLAGAKQLQRDTVSFSAATLQELLQSAQADKKQIRCLASVEPRGWVPQAVSELLEFPDGVASGVYPRRGHLGACGPIANLEQALRQGKLNDEGLIVLYAQGAGFTRAGVLLRIDSPPSPR